MAEAATPLDVIAHREDAAVTVALVGELDVSTVPVLRPVLLGLARDPSTFKITLDLEDLTFIDSTALNLFLSTDRSLRPRGGWLRIINPTPTARRVFEISGLDRSVTVVEASVSAAR